VFVGGAIGTLTRIGVSQLWFDPTFPWATLLINLAGSLGLGILAGSLARRPDRLLGSLIGAGFFGALTTFSTFAIEAVDLGVSGGLAATLTYVGLSVGAGLWLAAFDYRWRQR